MMLLKTDEEIDNEVLVAMRKLHPDWTTGLLISRVSFLSVSRVYSALERLESQGRITGHWFDAEVPYPRRRIYSEVN